MALGDVVQSIGFSVFSSSATLPESATVGNSIIVFSNATDASLSVSDDLNGAYTKIGTAGADPMISIFLVTNTSAASAPVITISSAGRRSFAMELIGDLVAANTGGSAVLSPLSVGPTSFSTSTANIPAGSVSVGAWGASVDGSGVTADSPWTGVPGNNVTYPFFVRQDASAVTGGAFSGTYDGFDGTFDATVLFVPLESAGGPSGPTLSVVPESAYPGETITITGSGLTGATADFGGETASVTVNSDTEIEVTISQGDLKFDTHTLTVTTSEGSATDDIELIVESGTGGYIDVVDPATTDESSLAYQFETAGGDPVATGDQCEWRYTGVSGDPTSVTVGADTLITALDQEGDLETRFWDATDSTWGNWATVTAEVPAVDETAPAISSASVPTAGDNIAVQMDEAMQIGEGGSGGWTISLAGVSVSSAAVDGSDDTIINLTPSRTLTDEDTFTIGYTQPGDGFQDQAETPNDLATLSGQAVTNNSNQQPPDVTAPTFTSVDVPTAGSYKAGDNLEFTANASETVTVTGTPQLPINIGGTTRQADYVSGTQALLFRYTVQAGDNDANGISIGSAIGLNGGSIADAATNNANLTLNSIGDTSGVLVDTVKPVITPVGGATTTIVVGSTYTDQGATAFDDQDGSLGTVTGTGSVDAETIGEYTITYPGAGVVDSAGNVADDATRTVNVVAEDLWPYGKGIRYAATQNWTWGKRHPKTGMRTRMYK